MDSCLAFCGFMPAGGFMPGIPRKNVSQEGRWTSQLNCSGGGGGGGGGGGPFAWTSFDSLGKGEVTSLYPPTRAAEQKL
eukprot:1136143-Pelagomonas_calceolata.AAC.1